MNDLGVMREELLLAVLGGECKLEVRFATSKLLGSGCGSCMFWGVQACSAIRNVKPFWFLVFNVLRAVAFPEWKKSFHSFMCASSDPVIGSARSSNLPDSRQALAFKGPTLASMAWGKGLVHDTYAVAVVGTVGADAVDGAVAVAIAIAGTGIVCGCWCGVRGCGLVVVECLGAHPLPAHSPLSLCAQP